jgi:amino acid transporter
MTDYSTVSSADAALDAGAADDVKYLEKLGYKQELNRLLGLFSAFAIQFSLVSVSAGMWSVFAVGMSFFGPAMFVAWVVGGAFQMVVGLSLGELVSAYPLAGGVYQIAGRLSGRNAIAWQTGWWLIIAHTVACAALAVFIAPYIAGWFGASTADTPSLLLWVGGILLLATAINYIGVRTAAIVNNIGVVTELLTGAIVIIVLLVVPHATQPISFLWNSGGTVPANGSPIQPFLFALLIPAFVISSFDSSGNAAEETVNAARNAPRGVIIANFLAFAIGTLLLALVLLAVQDLPAIMGSSTPLIDILKVSVGGTIAKAFEVLGVATLIVCIEMLQLTGARIIFAQARDGQLPASGLLRKLNREKIPANATILTFVIAMGLVVWAPLLGVLAAMTALAWAAAYGVVVFFGLLYWKRLPDRPWSYGRWSPWIYGVSLVWSVVLSIALIWSDPGHMIYGFAGVIIIGIVLYLLVPASRRGRITGVTDDENGVPLQPASAAGS